MLADVLAAIQTTVSALYPAVSASPVTFSQGGQYRYAKVSPPNVVWVPRRDSFAAPDPQGPSPLRTSSPARALRTRIAGVEAFIWGEVLDQTRPFDGTEQLLECVLNAIHQNCRGSTYELLDEEWAGQDGAEVMQAGRMVVLNFRLRLPVVERLAPALANATVLTAPQTDKMGFPGYSPAHPDYAETP